MSAVAREAQDMVFEAAKPIRPGETVKAQIRKACRVLGYPDGCWRITAAWYGHADSWSAQALRDLQDRFVEHREQQARRAASASQTEDLLRAQRDRADLEAARNEHRAMLARIERQLAACEAASADRIRHADVGGP